MGSRTKKRTSQRKLLLEIFKGKCFHCGEQLSFRKATRDHLVPISLHKTNHLSSLVLSCRPCNEKKGDTTPSTEDILRAERIHAEWRKEQVEKDLEMHRKHLQMRGVI